MLYNPIDGTFCIVFIKAFSFQLVEEADNDRCRYQYFRSGRRD